MDKNLPKTILIIREQDGEESYLLASENLEDVNLNTDEYITVGRYVLEGTTEMKLVPSVKEEE